MIRVENVSKSFGSFKALDGLSLHAGEGTVLGLLGPNGSGKTTTVKVLTTLLSPDSGDARIAGHSVLADPDLVRRNLGRPGSTPPWTRNSPLSKTCTWWAGCMA